MSLAESFETLAGQVDARTLFESPDVLAVQAGDTGYLYYRSTHAAGAIGMCQGEALLSALMDLEDAGCQTLVLAGNSAGAHFEEPMQGLFYLNALIESLTQLRANGVRIILATDGWLYGGAAMAAAACAEEIRLGPQARMGLFGPKVFEAADVTGSIPDGGFQPGALNLQRLSVEALLGPL